jgi:putative tryptophan/tyrosine transport system substrate-binding protein
VRDVRNSSPETGAPRRQALQALGWTEGRNVRLDVRWAAGDAGRMRTIVAEVVKQQPDAILVETTPQVAALMRENRSIPMVFVNVSDPIASGFVASIARPGVPPKSGFLPPSG